jgi:hypothetical protein
MLRPTSAPSYSQLDLDSLTVKSFDGLSSISAQIVSPKRNSPSRSRPASKLKPISNLVERKPSAGPSLHSLLSQPDSVSAQQGRRDESALSLPKYQDFSLVKSSQSRSKKTKDLPCTVRQSFTFETSLAAELPTSASGIEALTNWLQEMTRQQNVLINKMNLFGTPDSRSALDQAGLGRLMLQEAGLTDREIDALYRGLFTFSLGCFRAFYAIVKHCKQVAIVMGKVWQAYFVLIERADPDTHAWVMQSTEAYHAHKEAELRSCFDDSLKKAVNNVAELEATLIRIKSESRQLEIAALNSKTALRDLTTMLAKVTDQCDSQVEDVLDRKQSVVLWKAMAMAMSKDGVELGIVLKPLPGQFRGLHLTTDTIKVELAQQTARGDDLEHEERRTNSVFVELDRQLLNSEEQLEQFERALAEAKVAVRLSRLIVQEEMQWAAEVSDNIHAEESEFDALSTRLEELKSEVRLTMEAKCKRDAEEVLLRAEEEKLQKLWLEKQKEILEEQRQDGTSGHYSLLIYFNNNDV